MYRMGKIPSENETFSCVCDGCEFKVLEVSDKMITKVRAVKEQTSEA
jgi:CBS domain containing-hemolysin-like protein